MKNQLRKITFYFALFLIVAFVLFLVNQVLQIYLYFNAINPVVGKIVLISLSLLLIGLAATPVIAYLKLPPVLVPPKNEADKPAYLKRLTERIRQNKLIRQSGLDQSDPDFLTKSLEFLEIKANEIVERNAKAVFFTTAVSQNGKLDALSVFLLQTQLIWEVAHIYYQRPTLRQMVTIYGNVGATVFLVAQIEELDISQQIEPVVKSLLRNQGRGIPLVGPAANLVLDSVAEGAANAFLTLRIGIITRRYCSAREVMSRRSLKKGAFLEAAEQLRKLVFRSTTELIGIMISTTKRAGADTIRSGFQAVGNATGKVKNEWDSWYKKVLFRNPNPEAGQE
jgi:hypothetical protein